MSARTPRIKLDRIPRTQKGQGVDPTEYWHHLKVLLENPIFRLEFLPVLAKKLDGSTTPLVELFNIDARERDKHFGRREVLVEIEALLNGFIAKSEESIPEP